VLFKVISDTSTRCIGFDPPRYITTLPRRSVRSQSIKTSLHCRGRSFQTLGSTRCRSSLKLRGRKTKLPADLCLASSVPPICTYSPCAAKYSSFAHFTTDAFCCVRRFVEARWYTDLSTALPKKAKKSSHRRATRQDSTDPSESPSSFRPSHSFSLSGRECHYISYPDHFLTHSFHLV
jgi:hypothetical protein